MVCLVTRPITSMQCFLLFSVPLLSKVLPSDVCCLRKIGNCLRLDTTLIDISGLNSTRGDLSVIFNPAASPPMLILNHEKKTFQSIGSKHTQLAHDVAVLRSTELMFLRLSLDKMICNRNEGRNSRWIPGAGKTMVCLCVCVCVGKYHTTTYTINNLCLKTIRRCEHLKELQKRRTGRHHLRRGKHTSNDKVEKTDEIPISVPQLLDMLQVISPLNKFNKLRKALQTGLPPGFPVRMELPLVPTTMGRVLFTDVTIMDQSTQTVPIHAERVPIQSALTGASQTIDLFTVPPDYRYAGEFRLSKPHTKSKHKNA
ncbi:hypothetical protein FBUS_01228 [Fasciolopsis buskii]|uniref:Ankyrin repeat domain-containing protein n=1 Tax=Fasciolopsis buskii TaxID=27845 RepID=A0A8E0VHP5_9TREM|nr:hypothetical protein FBUS_01228 [Fasciolopsis buski]